MNGIQLNKQALALFLVFAAVGGAYYFFHYTKQVDPLSENLELKKKESDAEKSESTVPKKTRAKIDADGHYLPFYGYTIVSKIAIRHELGFIYDFMKKTKTLSKYLSPLPIASYHVTIFDIFSQSNIPDKYVSKSGNVPSSHWSKAMATLDADLKAAQRLCDQVEWESYFYKVRFNIGNVVSIYGNMSNSDSVAKFRKECLKIFPSTRRPNLKFHMTLGYFFRKPAGEEENRMMAELDELWKMLPEKFRLDHPSVCYFESMEEFVAFKNME